MLVATCFLFSLNVSVSLCYDDTALLVPFYLVDSRSVFVLLTLRKMGFENKFPIPCHYSSGVKALQLGNISPTLSTFDFLDLLGG